MRYQKFNFLLNEIYTYIECRINIVEIVVIYLYKCTSRAIKVIKKNYHFFYYFYIIVLCFRIYIIL